MSRRDEILQGAIGLFRSNGFDGVGIDEIGTVAGLTGPALYRHFPGGKWEIVRAAFDLAHEILRESFREAAPVDSPNRLSQLLRSYVTVNFDHSDLIALYLEGGLALPEPEQAALLRRQRSYISVWSRASRDERPGLRPAYAHTLVAVTLLSINAAASRPSRLPDSEKINLLADVALDMLRET